MRPGRPVLAVQCLHRAHKSRYTQSLNLAASPAPSAGAVCERNDDRCKRSQCHAVCRISSSASVRVGLPLRRPGDFMHCWRAAAPIVLLSPAKPLRAPPATGSWMAFLQSRRRRRPRNYSAWDVHVRLSKTRIGERYHLGTLPAGDSSCAKSAVNVTQLLPSDRQQMLSCVQRRVLQSQSCLLALLCLSDYSKCTALRLCGVTDGGRGRGSGILAIVTWDCGIQADRTDLSP